MTLRERVGAWRRLSACKWRCHDWVMFVARMFARAWCGCDEGRGLRQALQFGRLSSTVVTALCRVRRCAAQC